VTYQIGNGGLESFDVAIDGNAIDGALAGGISLERTAGDTSMPASYVTVCTDIEGTLYLGQQYTYNTPVTPFSGQSGLDPHWGATTASASQAIQNAAYLYNTYDSVLTGTLTSQTLTERAALQLAVWEVLYDTTTAGTVTVNGSSRFTVAGGSDAAAISLASTWISALNAQADAGNFGFTGYLLYPSEGGSVNADGQPPQELLFDVSVAAVPEPTTVIAGGLLLLPFAVGVFRITASYRRRDN
jgi:hypothetical protein